MRVGPGPPFSFHPLPPFSPSSTLRVVLASERTTPYRRAVRPGFFGVCQRSRQENRSMLPAALSRTLRYSIALSSLTLLFVSPSGAQRQENDRPAANWDLSNKFTTQALQRVTYSSTLQPRWIGKTDSMWYNWRDRAGATFYLVYPPTKTRRPLFDHVKLAAALATGPHKPYEPGALPFPAP